jgi:hypothetical protein
MLRQTETQERHLVLLGDQVGNFSLLAKRLLLDAPQSVSQSDFVRDVSTTLSSLSDRLRPFHREHLPRFDTVHNLATIYNESNGACHPAVASTLLAVVQFLQLFRYYEARARQPENHDEISVVGLCTGSLVAAAYACCASLDDLKALAVPTVSIAFQMGLSGSELQAACCTSRAQHWKAGQRPSQK